MLKFEYWHGLIFELILEQGNSSTKPRMCVYVYSIVSGLSIHISLLLKMYVGHLESKERLRIQPAQLFNFS